MDTLLTLLFGVGLLGYFGVSWLLHLMQAGRYFAALALAFGLLGAARLALLRVRLAQVLVLGAAVVSGTAVMTGHGALLLP